MTWQIYWLRKERAVKEMVPHFQKLLALMCALGQLKELCLRGNWGLCTQLTDDVSTTSVSAGFGPTLLSLSV